MTFWRPITHAAATARPHTIAIVFLDHSMQFWRQPYIVTLEVGKTFLAWCEECPPAAKYRLFATAAQEAAVRPVFSLSLDIEYNHCSEYC